MAMSLDEFFEMAKLGGQIQACHDIFKILQLKDITPDEITDKLALYHNEVFDKFKKSQLKFKMAKGMVRMDEDSIESLE